MVFINNIAIYNSIESNNSKYNRNSNNNNTK